MVSIVITLIVVGLLLYLVDFIPMDATVKKILNVVVIVFLVLWLLGIFSGHPFLRW